MKMTREFEKSDIFFAHGIENADGGVPRALEADNDAPRATELALKRQHTLWRRLEVLLEEAFENIHERLFAFAQGALTKIDTQGKQAQDWQGSLRLR